MRWSSNWIEILEIHTFKEAYVKFWWRMRKSALRERREKIVYTMNIPFAPKYVKGQINYKIEQKSVIKCSMQLKKSDNIFP